MPGQPEEPKPGPQDGDELGDRQEKLNESVATGEDEDEVADDSFAASDPPATS